MIRQPIVVLVGHIDHGKSSILERIKGISITKSEAGGITQSIKSYKVSLKNIESICGNLLKNFPLKIKIPGLLFLDSPGHAAFNNMRKRGGNLADIAILVIDIIKGIEEQTLECIDILKQYKTPFVIALNKIDLISGWRQNPSTTLLQNLKSQSSYVQEDIDNRTYKIIGKISELGFNAERFDRVDDYTKQVTIIPLSAKTSEGIPELLMVMVGLAQRYLEKSLQIEVKGEGIATILEVSELEGLGTTLDIILHDGSIKVNDQIVIGTLNEPITTKVKAICESEKNKLIPLKEVHAAAGIKITAPNLKDVIGGMPLRVVRDNLDRVIKEIKEEIEEVLYETDKEGVVIKADTLGSLEALSILLKEKNIKIKKASIGDITKKDINEALAEKDPLNRVVLGFNIRNVDDKSVKIITNSVIYRIIDDHSSWTGEEKRKLEKIELEKITRPCKIKVLRGFVFRQSNPAVVGVQVLAGILKSNTQLMKKDGSKASHIKEMQKDAVNIQEATQGFELAISIPGVIIGRQLKEDDILYSDIDESKFIKLKKLKKYLKDDEIEVLKEIAEIKRKENPTWGV